MWKIVIDMSGLGRGGKLLLVEAVSDMAFGGE